MVVSHAPVTECGRSVGRRNGPVKKVSFTFNRAHERNDCGEKGTSNGVERDRRVDRTLSANGITGIRTARVRDADRRYDMIPVRTSYVRPNVCYLNNNNNNENNITVNTTIIIIIIMCAILSPKSVSLNNFIVFIIIIIICLSYILLAFEKANVRTTRVHKTT